MSESAAWRDRLVAISRCELDDRSLTPGEASDILVALKHQESRVDVLGFACSHVLRYGRLGKQSRGRIVAALRAVGWDRG